jgi:hypothetical protein
MQQAFCAGKTFLPVKFSTVKYLAAFYGPPKVTILYYWPKDGIF